MGAAQQNFPTTASGSASRRSKVIRSYACQPMSVMFMIYSANSYPLPSYIYIYIASENRPKLPPNFEFLLNLFQPLIFNGFGCWFHGILLSLALGPGGFFYSWDPILYSWDPIPKRKPKPPIYQ